uniref:Uncharacterized protein n=1 Tax=Candidatus Kentrum sp. TC TaxID=2126339 RepID=A0A450YQE7_9GAMM|nr:MAG: hypothetical protein BECKTC1821E_GA0114239_102824 [Candidatus Kentron sp. TC]VFK44309.1 MAG: hypothetical protein BECKTC1821D_GA0114238_102018 [Candidatus Kentron sp. TC]VFK58443.1 MAG: hypothetical protein BECKTC1821F_GA0114240_102421 [Candidatus Kentron sp. TC]
MFFRYLNIHRNDVSHVVNPVYFGHAAQHDPDTYMKELKGPLQIHSKQVRCPISKNPISKNKDTLKIIPARLYFSRWQ